MTRIAVSTLSRTPMAMSLAQLALFLLILLAFPVAAFAHEGAGPWHTHLPGSAEGTLRFAPWIAGAILSTLVAIGVASSHVRARVQG